MKTLLGYKELRKDLENSFKKASIDETSDIDWIICEITGKRRSELPLIKLFSSEEMKKIMDAISLRLKHVPLAYIFGKTNFYGYTIKVSHDVLIPRLDSEILVERVCRDLKILGKRVSVLDLCTGSGALAIVIQKETRAKVVASDISEKAILIATENANLNNAEIEFIESNLFEKLKDRKFDIIVSNPPYIESDLINSLDKEVKNNEPTLALDGGKDGLDYYRKIIRDAPRYLKNKGKIYFEIGYNQAEIVSNLMSKNFKNIEVLKDYEGNDRVVLGELYD